MIGGARVFLWGLFCSCSWTWCIGMFLPIVLLERYGWPGFIAFAVPNVLGCALFGFVVRTGERSERLVREHGAAMRWFSAITIAYHVFFAAWLAVALLPETLRHPALPAALPLAMVAAGLMLGGLGDRLWLWLTAIVYAISVAALVSLVPDGLHGIPWRGDEPANAVPWIAPVLCFGFMLCPYLDATFHRALQRSAPGAFAVFGVTFAAMLVLTCAYWERPGLRLETLVAAHLAAQGVFTVGAHLRELRLLAAARRPAWLGGPLLALLALPVLLLAADPVGAGTDLYLRFLAFYGAVFPAYVLLFMATRRRPERRAVLGLLAVTALLAPFYELGMLHGRPWLLAPPMLVYGAWWWIGTRDWRSGIGD